ncbi:DNA polymerase III subunit gamma/tau [Candidatus Finniella inopinata]|uniref:DNA polymerase III subunit gamma/tau n=1 Tax=Candidatus Finniella inopinata TaxID=1696036 RepID=A0A4Q7DMZ1_9PROT|nr:DNA polymerase III subunit gamma/tau [Candidatus Finniella inopinata]RZI46216.1 DNA polymerase III subunit gamma/tau [Candidatus Finniella inopinata]
MIAGYRVLARKYRPTVLGDLVGQDLLVQTLGQAIHHNRLPHAFLLHGIRGVGKTTTARIMARVLNCLNNHTETGKSIDACGQCASCKSLTDDRHLDVIEIDAASRTGVDDVREIIDSSRYKAVTGQYKIFIIDEVHMLSKSAFNALLKTLEEPPPHVKFIFATTEIRKIPDTILSRCMRFDLKRIEPKLLVDYLKKIAGLEGFVLEEEAAFSLARAADGSMRDGLSLLDQAIALSFTDNRSDRISAQTVYNMLGLADRQRLFKLLGAVLEGQPDVTLQHTADLLHDGADAQLLLQDILDILYGLICLKTVPQFQKESFWSQADREAGSQLTAPLAVSTLLSLWQALLNALQEVKIAPVPSQALELALLRACYLSDLPPLENLIQSLKGGRSRDSTLPVTSQALHHLVGQAPVVAQTQHAINKPAVSLPTSFTDLAKLVSNAREPMLYTQLLHDVDCIQYQPGEMTLYVKPTVPATFLATLKQVLQTVTQHTWIIHLAKQPGQGSLEDQKKALQRQAYEEVLSHLNIQAIQNAFPGSTLEIIN